MYKILLLHTHTHTHGKSALTDTFSPVDDGLERL